MNSGNSDMLLLRHANLLGFLTVEAACVLLEDKSTSTAVKALARLVARGHIHKFQYLRPRCYWGPRALGAQRLVYCASVAFRCVLAEDRLWSPVNCQGPATIIVSGGEREALFVDFGAEPRSLARKVGGHENPCLVVPSEDKARAVARYIDGVRFVVFPDLWRLQCQSPKGRR